MEEIYIIEEQGFQLFNDRSAYVSILYPSDENLLEDYQLHDWVVQIFDKFNPTSLVIPLSIRSDRFLGLMLGMHIRLNYDLNHSQRTIPIIFISEDFTYESLFSDIDLEIKQNRALPHYLLTTPNIHLEPPVLELIRDIVQLAKPMTEIDYNSKFLNSIKVNLSESTGKHSIANIWGAFQLAKTTGCIKELTNNKKLLRYQKDLYFKYIRALSLEVEEYGYDIEDTSSNIRQNVNSRLTIEAKNKNILFIDDEAGKGWDIVLQSIFVGAQFEIVGRDVNESASSFCSRAKSKALEVNEINLPHWDLILLDLRLDESEDLGENANKKASEFTGANLLKDIKKANEGTQVIMFTASNKAWNMRDLMSSNLGANGFFIKEAPEYNQDQTFSNRNFKNFEEQVITSLERRYLSELFLINKSIESRLNLENGVLCNKSITRSKVNLILAYIRQAFNSLKLYTELQKEYALYSFLDYYKIIETLGKELILEKEDSIIIRPPSNAEFIVKSPTFLSRIEPVKEEKKIIGFRINDYVPASREKHFYEHPTSSTKFAAIMLLKFRFSEADVQQFISLNNLRNNIAAHSANKIDEEIKVKDVLDIAKLLKRSFQKL